MELERLHKIWKFENGYKCQICDGNLNLSYVERTDSKGTYKREYPYKKFHKSCWLQNCALSNPCINSKIKQVLKETNHMKLQLDEKDKELIGKSQKTQNKLIKQRVDLKLKQKQVQEEWLRRQQEELNKPPNFDFNKLEI